jgi:UDP-glucose 4-epimerase
MADRPSLAGKSVLVLGGAGFIGSHLVDRLVEEGVRRVSVVDNLFLGREANLSQARDRLGGALRFHRLDGTDDEALARVIGEDETEVVFNLAVVPLPASLEQPRWSVEHNVDLALIPCELLREGLFETLIHVSSSEAYGSAAYVPMDEAHPPVPSTPYAASKLAGDQIVLSYQHTFGLDAAIVRPFNNFGPRQNSGSYAGIIPIVVSRATAGESIEIFGDGEQTRDFVFVRDTADAMIRMYEEPATRGRVVNVASGREVSVNDLVRLLLDALGSDVPVRHVEPRPGDVRRHWASIDLARELIGYEPSTSLRDGLAETVAWYLRSPSPSHGR